MFVTHLCRAEPQMVSLQELFSTCAGHKLLGGGGEPASPLSLYWHPASVSGPGPCRKAFWRTQGRAHRRPGRRHSEIPPASSGTCSWPWNSRSTSSSSRSSAGGRRRRRTCSKLYSSPWWRNRVLRHFTALRTTAACTRLGPMGQSGGGGSPRLVSGRFVRAS